MATTTFSLKDYQQKIVDETTSALVAHQRVVVACPTGSGKTVIALHGLLPTLSGKTAWLTHRKELAKQVKDYRQGVDVFMAQSAVSGDYQNIIIDEGHHVTAEQYRKTLADYSQSKIIALTATPYRLDGVGLGSCGFSKIIHGPDLFELTENGTLCPVKVFIPRSEKTSAWSTIAASERIAETSFNKGIVYCRSVKEAAELAKILTGKNIRAESIDGSTNQKSREALFDEFVNGDIKILCNHTIFTEGTDVPCLDLVVLNRYTYSRCLWKQMIGRGTRKAEGKSVCTILDLAGNGVFHGSIYDREIYDLNGKVDSTESRVISEFAKNETENYKHNEGEELKEWKPQLKPISIIESLRRLKLKSPLHRLRTV